MVASRSSACLYHMMKLFKCDSPLYTSIAGRQENCTSKREVPCHRWLSMSHGPFLECLTIISWLGYEVKRIQLRHKSYQRYFFAQALDA